MAKILLFVLLLIPQISFAQNPVYISQVQITGGSGKTDRDFIELFNPSSTAFNLKGCRLVKRSANSLSDTLVKSWSKDTWIPAKSFYLWANANYIFIPQVPDATSTATLAENNGIALRQGASNTGTILDSLSWGKTENQFKNVSTGNPQADQAFFRENLYSDLSAFVIRQSDPRNSKINDLSTAFEQSQKPLAVNPVKQVENNQNTSLVQTQNQTAPAQNLPEQQSAINTENKNINPEQEKQVGAYSGLPSRRPNIIKYLLPVGGSLLLLLFLIKKSLLVKNK